MLINGTSAVTCIKSRMRLNVMGDTLDDVRVDRWHTPRNPSSRRTKATAAGNTSGSIGNGDTAGTVIVMQGD